MNFVEMLIFGAAQDLYLRAHNRPVLLGQNYVHMDWSMWYAIDDITLYGWIHM